MITIRKIEPELDVESICSIYNFYIQNGAITFDENSWSKEGMLHKIEHILKANYPYYVACENDKVLGFYYLNEFNFRTAYHTTAELTIYLSPEVRGKGIGTLLMEHLMEHVDRERFHTLVSLITIPNPPSTNMHEKYGFRKVGELTEVGRKFDQWHNVGYYQLIFES